MRLKQTEDQSPINKNFAYIYKKVMIDMITNVHVEYSLSQFLLLQNIVYITILKRSVSYKFTTYNI